MAYMKRARPGGSLASVVAGLRIPTRTIVAMVAARTALRRPDSTRNVPPSYRDDAQSAPSVGQVAALTTAAGWRACGRWASVRRREGGLNLATPVAGRWGTVRIR